MIPLKHEGVWFECVCCYGEAVFEAMVQCEEVRGRGEMRGKREGKMGGGKREGRDGREEGGRDGRR